jgi:hypothetical protein
MTVGYLYAQSAFLEFSGKAKNTWRSGGVRPMSMEYVPSDVMVGVAELIPYPFYCTMQDTPPILITRISPYILETY